MKLQNLTNHENTETKRADEKLKMVFQWNLNNSKNASMPPLHPYIKMDINLEVGISDSNFGNIIVRFMNSYSIKDILKAQGYKYGYQNWFKSFTSFEEAKAEAEKLQYLCK